MPDRPYRSFLSLRPFVPATTINGKLSNSIPVHPAGALVCFRKACSALLALNNTWWNIHTEHWYCQSCALWLNRVNDEVMCTRRQHPNMAELIEEKMAPLD